MREKIFRAYLRLEFISVKKAERQRGKREGLKNRIMEERSVLNTAFTPIVLVNYILTRILLNKFDEGAVMILS